MLWATGCSHTFGDDLSDKQKAWPFVLSKMLDSVCINNAVSGGSNERILYQSLKIKKQKIAVIAWTYVERFTRYRQDNNFEVNFNPAVVHKMYGSMSEYKNYAKLHYTVWYNNLYSFKIWLQQIILLQSYFKCINQPYLMVNSTDNNISKWICEKKDFIQNINQLVNFELMNDNQLYNEWEEIVKYYELIDHSNFFNFKDYYLTQYCKDYPVGPTGHLLEQGHTTIAKDLYQACSTLIR